MQVGRSLRYAFTLSEVEQEVYIDTHEVICPKVRVSSLVNIRTQTNRVERFKRLIRIQKHLTVDLGSFTNFQ